MMKTTIKNHLVFYTTPTNFNYNWNLGSLIGYFLVIQIISGLTLSMHYAPHTDLAFLSVENIMSNVPNGWLFRYIHANGASFMFFFLYLHMGRNIYYKSYVAPRHLVWTSGVLLFVLAMATAFLGYVLPWGQMSYWAATVITNFFSAMPYIGSDMAQWLWGGFSVGNPTLNSFYSLHFLLPFVMAALVVYHLKLLHEVGSNNPLGIHTDYQPFHSYFSAKDFFGMYVTTFAFVIVVFFYPNVLGHPDNYMPADPLTTPAHIVPEWYFCAFYGILRSIPNKLGGVIAMGLSILVLFLLPFITVSNKLPISPMFSMYHYKVIFWMFLVWPFLMLAHYGSSTPSDVVILMGQIYTVMYFATLLIIIPFFEYIELYCIHTIMATMNIYTIHFVNYGKKYIKYLMTK